MMRSTFFRNLFDKGWIKILGYIKDVDFLGLKSKGKYLILLCHGLKSEGK